MQNHSNPKFLLPPHVLNRSCDPFLRLEGKIKLLASHEKSPSFTAPLWVHAPLPSHLQHYSKALCFGDSPILFINLNSNCIVLHCVILHSNIIFTKLTFFLRSLLLLFGFQAHLPTLSPFPPPFSLSQGTGLQVPPSPISQGTRLNWPINCRQTYYLTTFK